MKHHNPQYHDIIISWLNHANDHNDQEPVPISRQHLDRDLLAPAHTHETGGQHHHSLVFLFLLFLSFNPPCVFRWCTWTPTSLRCLKAWGWKNVPSGGNFFLNWVIYFFFRFSLGVGGEGWGLYGIIERHIDWDMFWIWRSHCLVTG